MGNLSSLVRNIAVRDENGAEDIEMRVAYDNSNCASNPQDEDSCYCERDRNPEEYWPSDDLLAEEYRKERLGLYTAALNGDWKRAESIIKDNPGFINSSITEEYQTALHVAAGAKQRGFLKKLVNLMEKGDLKLQDKNGNTAFCHAVITGSVPVAKLLLKEVPQLALIRGGANSIPLSFAVISERHEMATLLFRETENHLDHIEMEHVQEIFFNCIQTDMFDLALRLLKRYEDLAVARNTNNETALHMLARKSSAFDRKGPGIVRMLSSSSLKLLEKFEHLIVPSPTKPSAFVGKRTRILKKLINSCKDFRDATALELVRNLWTLFLEKTENVIEEIDSPFNLMFKAAKLGSYEFLATLIRMHPELIWETDRKNQTIFHIAVLHRHVDIFNQIYSIGSIKDVVVTYEIHKTNSEVWDNMLHLAAQIPSPHQLDTVSGSALQMQRELLWFQEVNSMVRSCDREKKGLEGLTPRKLFSKEHKYLLENGKKWMRNTSNSCMIVATLITTVVYSAGFSIPGGNNNTNGSPVLINHTLFHVFTVSEGVALSFSITSTLMFLYILTSRYAEEDFLRSLPLKLMVGLATLFISMLAMIIAFTSAFCLAYRDSYNHQNSRWVPLLVSGFASLPAAFFIMLQYPLLRDIFHSTCCSRSLFRPKKSMFV